MRGPFRAEFASAALAIGLVIAGCGSSEEGDVVDTYRDFLSAYGQSDAEAACGLLTEAAQEQLVEFEGSETCAEVVSGERPNYGDGYLAESADTVSSDDVTIEGAEATLDTGLYSLSTAQPPPLGVPPGTPPPAGVAVPTTPPPPNAEFERVGEDWKISGVAFMQG